METLESFSLDLSRNDHLFSFDISKGYHHFRLHPSIRNLFLFRVDGRYFRCIALPFGWKLSPYYFIKIIRPFVQFARHRFGMRIHPYIDDFLVASSTVTKLRRARDRIHWLLTGCGLKRKVEKGCWAGSQRLDHLGFVIDTKALVFGITQKRMEKLRGIARQLLSQARRNRHLVSESLLRHFAGVAISCSLAMPLARFYTRSIYDSIRISKPGPRVKLVHAAMRDLRVWCDLTLSPSTRLIHKQAPEMAVHSDASTTVGQGGTLGSDLRPGSQGCWEARGLWDPVMRSKPITFLELRAVTDNFKAFASEIKSGTHLRVWEDNQAVVYMLNSMTSKSRAMMHELRALHRVLTKIGVTIESKYLPSAVNRFADRLSRLQTLDDWRINLSALQPYLRRLPPTIDRFADRENSICRQFNSEFSSPGSTAVNALTQDWRHEVNFWNPPLKLLPLVVSKICHEQATGVLVTPWWPAQSSCTRLQSIATPRIFDAPYSI